ncbi:MAG: restriction endonuclease subunit R [Aphanocapsa lilacina HA4352-LM1]|jgi:predicted type IV restriction endonuclease|nr:restriction endonuclease subunit R [Aphanocapsa lilacina HA4352-LM1]
MVQAVPAREIKLADLRDQFGLEQSEERGIFREWRADLPEIESKQKQELDLLKRRHRYLAQYGAAEEVVKLTMLAPLLAEAGFFDDPFRIETETPVEIAAEEDGVIFKGRIDVLVVSGRLWVLVIESKKMGFNVTEALPQALLYMLSSPAQDRPSFGMATNGEDFLFIKLLDRQPPQYALSRKFTLITEDSNELFTVFRILKRLGQLIRRTN